jgi:hypothetical protein
VCVRKRVPVLRTVDGHVVDRDARRSQLPDLSHRLPFGLFAEATTITSAVKPSGSGRPQERYDCSGTGASAFRSAPLRRSHCLHERQPWPRSTTPPLWTNLNGAEQLAVARPVPRQGRVQRRLRRPRIPRRNRLQSERDARCQDSRCHFPFVAHAAMETAVLLEVPVDPKQKSLLAASAASRQLGVRGSGSAPIPQSPRDASGSINTSSQTPRWGALATSSAVWSGPRRPVALAVP